jgi:hypothetical protein
MLTLLKPRSAPGETARAGMEKVSSSTSAEHPYGLGSDDLASLAELIRQTPGAPTGSVMRGGAMSARATRNSTTSWPWLLPHATPTFLPSPVADLCDLETLVKAWPAVIRPARKPQQ